jgi:hypothetical protein
MPIVMKALDQMLVLDVTQFELAHRVEKLLGLTPEDLHT